MYGAIIGDIVGSVYEFNNIKTKDFSWLGEKNRFTDDTVMTAAVADAIMKCDREGTICDMEQFKDTLCDCMHHWGRMYWTAGYGQRFMMWLLQRAKTPYNSYGNGSAMRVSPVAWYCSTLASTLLLAEATAQVTHNHPEGIKGAVAVAGLIFLARTGSLKDELRAFARKCYDLDFTLEDIRPTYRHVESCQQSVPQALQAFFEANNFEDAIRNAISIGGDSDTIAAITGSIAHAYYGIPAPIKHEALAYLDDPLRSVVEEFQQRYM